jgi:hypothetical protein
VGRKNENTGFRCVVCGESVRPLTNGSYRNHCPFCLSSLHVDERGPGDRASDCAGVMDAVDVVHSKKGWQIVHQCRWCGAMRSNRIADGTDQPDDVDWLVGLMASKVDR